MESQCGTKDDGEDARLIQSEIELAPAPRRLSLTLVLSVLNFILLSALLLLLATRNDSNPCMPEKHPHWIAPESEEMYGEVHRIYLLTAHSPGQQDPRGQR